MSRDREGAVPLAQFCRSLQASSAACLKVDTVCQAGEIGELRSPGQAEACPTSRRAVAPERHIQEQIECQFFVAAHQFEFHAHPVGAGVNDARP